MRCGHGLHTETGIPGVQSNSLRDQSRECIIRVVAQGPRRRLFHFAAELSCPLEVLLRWKHKGIPTHPARKNSAVGFASTLQNCAANRISVDAKSQRFSKFTFLGRLPLPRKDQRQKFDGSRGSYPPSLGRSAARLLRRQFRYIDLGEIEGNQLLSRALPKIDLNPVQKGPSTPVSFVGGERQLFPRLPFLDVKGARPDQRSSFTALADGVTWSSHFRRQFRVRVVPLDDHRVHCRQHRPVVVSRPQCRRDRLRRYRSAVMEFDTVPQPELPPLIPRG